MKIGTRVKYVGQLRCATLGVADQVGTVVKNIEKVNNDYVTVKFDNYKASSPEGLYVAAIKRLVVLDTPTAAGIYQGVEDIIHTLRPHTPQLGMKFDGGKPRWTLLMQGMPLALNGVAEVLTFGAKKYADHSWQKVDQGLDRYSSAMLRHLNMMMRDGWNSKDAESGLRHIDHLNTNGLFLGELIRKEFGAD